MSSKITIKRSAAALPPTGLSFGEMAFVQGTGLTADQLYIGISGGSPIWIGAEIGTTGTWTDTSARTSLATQYAIDQRISNQISATNLITTAADNSNATRYLVFTTAAGTGVTLGVDTSGPLSYNPLFSTLTMTGDLDVNGGDINTSSVTGTIFNSTVTGLSIGSAATGITMGAVTGNFGIRNPSLTVGSSGVTGTIYADDGNLILTTKNYSGTGVGGDSSPQIVINDNIGVGFVNIEGGDLRLGTKISGGGNAAVDIVFEGTTDNGFETTLTVVDPTVDRTLSLPNATDTLVGKATSDVFTNKTFDTAGSGNVFRIAGVTLTAVTGTGNVNVLATSPAITTSLTTPSTSFDLINTTATTVNFAGAATTLNLGASGGTATFGGNVVVTGDFTVQGNTTTLNTSTLNVEDFNITMGLTLTSAALCTGAGIGIGVGTGITFAYDHATSAGWLSSVNLDLATAKTYKIGGTTVLSSSALGSGVTGSSLTQVGTITSGTWQGTQITDTYLAQITTASKVANSATTATNANTASAIVARDASGNFSAGTITAALTGNASTATSATSATTATNANNVAITTENSDVDSYITFVTTNSSGNQAVKVSNQLQYNALTGELSATLIDGGSF